LKKIILTIDTEFIRSKDEILGIKGSNGIDDILSILEEYNIKATFFIDYYEETKWGEKIFSDVTTKIKSAGHQIELHVHPNLYDKKPTYLWQYDYSEQSDLLDESIIIYNKHNVQNPKFFRAGGYSANDDTIKLLYEKKFLGDLSFQFKQKRCKISENVFNEVNKIGYANKLLEIPTTVYKYRLIKERYNSINLEWCSLSELKEISNQIKNSELDYFVVMMHSFSFLNRWDRVRIKKNNSQKRKFIKFLKYAIDSGFEFDTVSEFHQNIQNKKLNADVDFIPQIENSFVILSGVLTKVKNKFILNKKFRRQLESLFLIVFLLFLMFLYLFFFKNISPGYNEIKNVKVEFR